MKSFYWILAIIVIFVGFIGVAAYFKNRSVTNEPLPTIEVTSSDHVKGNGPNVLMEYGDFQCPACGQYYPIVTEFLKQKGSEVTFVFRHFPLAQHPNAYPAAQAAEAAGNQGKFFEMYDKLYQTQNDWAALSNSAAFDLFKKYASDIGLDTAKFEADYALKETKGKIQNSYRGGVALGVNQTPSFFFNGTLIKNPGSLEEFLKLVSPATSTTPININNTQL